MKRLIILALITGVLSLSGCDNEDARKYANELAGVLKTYEVEVNKKIAAEQKSYKELAANYAYAREVEVLTNLGNERLKRSETVAEELLADEKLTTADIHSLVADYAHLEFESTRKMFEQESDGQAEFLASLESLELQSQNLTALRKALEAMAKSKGKIKQLKEFGASAKQFKAKFDELQCEDVAEQIACLKKRLEAINKKKLEAIKKRDDLSAAGKQDQMKEVQNEIDSLSDQMEEVQSEIDSLIELSNEQKCDTKKRDATKCPESKG